MAEDRLDTSRRAVMKAGLSAGFGVGLASAATGAMAEALAGYEPTVLTQTEFATVGALMARLIPADEHGPGAVEAGAPVYLDRALAGFHAKSLAAWRQGLGELDRRAFATRPAAEQDALIAAMEKGELTGSAFADGGRAFFALARLHTVEGLLCDPIYGGNQDFIGWTLIGYQGVQLYYSPETQRLNGRDDRAQRSVGDWGGSPLA